MHRINLVLAGLAFLSSIALEIVSTVNYVDPKKPGSELDAIKKTENVQKFHNWAVILMIASVYFLVQCMVMKQML